MAHPGSITIRFHLRPDEYAEALELFRRARYQVPPECWVGGVLSIASSLWFFHATSLLIALVALLAGLGLTVAAPHLRRVVQRRIWQNRWRNEPFFQAENVVTFSESGIRYLIGRVESELDWKYYRYFLETPHGILVVTAGLAISLFPRRSFAGEEDWQALRQLVTTQLTPFVKRAQ
jgi:hypothetical protein